MSDILLELGKNERARRLIQGLGLPIPVPQTLMRADGPSIERPLFKLHFAVRTFSGSKLGKVLATGLAQSGATVHLPVEAEDDAKVSEVFAGPAEAYSLPVMPLSLSPEDPQRFAGAVFDATTMAGPEELMGLYEFFGPLVRRISRCGRAVVITRPQREAPSAEVAAAWQACEGFVRSLAKEVGRKGATAQLLRVGKGAEERVLGPLRFFLSERSAYVSGQQLEVSALARPLAEPAPFSAPLEGKVALVTGAARGIGARCAHLLSTEGATVVCLDRPQDDGPVSRLARELGGDVLLCDVLDEDAPKRIAQHLKSVHGGVDIVVHNAGITKDKTLAKMKRETWAQVLSVNLQAVLRIHRGMELEVLRDEGRIVCLSSIAGIAGNMGQTNYAASKAGIIGMVKAFSAPLAQRGVTVNAVAPGFIETRLTARIPATVREVGRRLNSLGQGGLPEDVAQVINFLASPGAQGVTGQVLRVCGGSLLGR